MNYRHAFHAGNFADVLKHAALALCIDRLNQKPAPWRLIDTHAGTGLYDLDSEEARRSPEWRDGIARVWEVCAGRGAPMSAEVREAIAPLLDVLRRLNPDGLKHYPGSPAIALGMARADDAIRICELHEPSFEALRTSLGRDRRIKVEMRDGYEALPAYLPPPERRGIVLVDPPFEEGTAERRLDFEHMGRAAVRAVRRWPLGTYIFWRPLKDLDQVEAFDGELATRLVEDAGVAPDKLLVADLWVRELGQPGGLAGAGVVIVNPPYQLDEKLAALLPWLAELLAQGEGAGWRLQSADAEG